MLMRTQWYKTSADDQIIVEYYSETDKINSDVGEK